MNRSPQVLLADCPEDSSKDSPEVELLDSTMERKNG